jgi:hypothetical protein
MAPISGISKHKDVHPLKQELQCYIKYITEEYVAITVKTQCNSSFRGLGKQERKYQNFYTSEISSTFLYKPQ